MPTQNPLLLVPFCYIQLNHGDVGSGTFNILVNTYHNATGNVTTKMTDTTRFLYRITPSTATTVIMDDNTKPTRLNRTAEAMTVATIFRSADKSLFSRRESDSLLIDCASRTPDRTHQMVSIATGKKYGFCAISPGVDRLILYVNKATPNTNSAPPHSMSSCRLLTLFAQPKGVALSHHPRLH